MNYFGKVFDDITKLSTNEASLTTFTQKRNSENHLLCKVLVQCIAKNLIETEI